MNKKILSALISLVILCSLTACGRNTTPKSAKRTDTEVTQNFESPTQNEIKYAPSELLGDSALSFQIQIKDRVYTFPMPYAEFVGAGWELDSKHADINDMLESHCDALAWFYNDELHLDFFVFNPDVSAKPYSECVISGVYISYTDVSVEEQIIFTPGGLIWGVSTSEDALAVFGEPESRYDGNTGTIALTYSDTNKWSNAKFRFENGDVLSGYVVNNPVMPDGFVESGVVTINIDYTAPTEISSNPTDTTVYFGGQLYELPAPVQAFIDNGWSIMQEDIVVSGRSIAFINMSRGSDEIRCTIHNPLSDAVSAETAYITNLSSNDLFREQFIVAGNISKDTKENELISILDEANVAYETKDDSYGRQYSYKIGNAGILDYCYIKFENGEVSYIAVNIEID